MAPAVKKRKVTSFEPTRGIAVVVPAKASIAAFARVSKSATATLSSKSTKLRETDGNILKCLSNSKEQSIGVKRKPEAELRTPGKAVKTNTGKAILFEQENALPIILEHRSSTPEPPRLPKRQNLKDTVVKEPDTPTKGTCARLESFTITSSPSRKSYLPTPHHSSSPAASTPCPKNKSKRQHEEDLPQEVQDLIDLHGAFLTALSLYYAHHGTAAPVDLRNLASPIGKAWGQRTVAVDDVRRILALQQRSVERPDQAALLSVWDYGKGKVCIEYCASADDDGSAKPSWAKNAHRQPLDSANLGRAFTAYIQDQYASAVEKGTSAEEFVAGLPLVRLHRRAKSRRIKSTVLSKGQQRLTELKAGAILAQKRNEPKGTTSPSSLAPLNSTDAHSSEGTKSQSQLRLPPSQRSDSLLSRIRAKESLLASRPAGPSVEQLERRSALQRVPDVVAVLSVLFSNSAGGVTLGRHSAVLAPSPMSASGPNRNLSNDDVLAAALGMNSSSNSSAGVSKHGLSGMFGNVGLMTVKTPLPTPPPAEKMMSMSLMQVVQHLQNSMRTPMARAEIESVVRILAAEVAPEWVQLRELGSVKALTFRGPTPGKGWRERAECLMAQS